MNAPATGTTPAKTSTNGTTKERKKTERIPRTDEAKVMSACDAVLKKTTPEIRGKVMRALTALYGE